ncbi:DUF4240 domain-containing protein [Actinokineospora sp. NBRC 105648]|uniref:DUF4240 domain-containing protein n=1 Tax=Actinokineospora sp. NBRC 105648 TaxID=3032206 RepID=UPI0024A1C6D4|nr:DUF4240 domain-containing protein [Actinokineospora sp. NBRC 105648]GLZ42953.1 hypothetical protein Acsp05_65770 [Actinokineospora sp. NBRC 105648]
MTDEAFWQLLARAVEQPGDRAERAEWLTEELTRLPVAQTADFARHLAAARARANTWPLWAAATVIRDGWCAEGGFRDFQFWLLTLGRADFDRVTADPDTLAELPQVQALATPEADWPEWAALDSVARDAQRETTGADPTPPEATLRPPTQAWPPADTAKHLPRLTALFAAPRPQPAM